MSKTLKLTDLYVIGKEFVVEGPEGSITVWLQKLTPVQQETAFRRAGSQRAKILALARGDEGDLDTKQSAISTFYDMYKTREEQINYLVSETLMKVYPAREAEVAARDEWSDDDYLQGLKDSWNEEMFNRFINDSNDQEANKVKDEIQRFQDELNEEIESERKFLVEDLSSYTDSKIVELGCKSLLESSADMAWLTEFRKCELWFGVRNPNTKKQYFSGREEVDELSTEVLGALIKAFAELNVDATEGKD